MLKFKIKLNQNDIKQDELVWREKYLAPDLSYVSGVTDTAYHLEKHDKLSCKSSLVNVDGVVTASTMNVLREGYVVVVGKTYKIYDSSFVRYPTFGNAEQVNYSYLFINGKYFYYHQIDKGLSGYTIDNLLNYSNGDISEDIVISDDSIIGNTVKIDTVYWIEDGIVNIDGDEYFYDKNEGVLKYGENGNPLISADITDCDKIECYEYSKPSDYQEVTKFILTKDEEIDETFDNISFCNYYYFINYNNQPCKILKKINDDGSYVFVCEINVKNDDETVNTIEKNVYYNPYDYNSIDLYREAYNENLIINSENYESHKVKELNELKNISAFVYIDNAFYGVEHDVVNANGGSEIIVYLNNEYSPLNIGSVITLVDTSSRNILSELYSSDRFNEEFVLYNGKKYIVQKELCDKVVINDNEYDIDYINGKISSTNCIVDIDGEEVPMYIKSIDNGEYHNGELERYGTVVKDASIASSNAVYPIKSYDGIIMGDVSYIITDDGESGDTRYANIDDFNKYPFVITEILGNSSYICEPYIYPNEVDADFKREISVLICQDVVNNQYMFDLRVKNTLFGNKEITRDLGFKGSNVPSSSDDYYSLFNDLKVYVNNGYINIPLSLNMDASNNAMQEDMVLNEFVKAEKEKAVNTIVDMEKDVYLPKYIDNKYDCSKTVFKSIHEINFNFHFRTRDLESWKVKENGNWFVTDYEPYKSVLSSKNLQNVSDLMGLLYFTNDDIFYQKSRVGKSFIRLSFYDSTDAQNQELLATSCIFVDEHNLFKRYIDNSLKNVRSYIICDEEKVSEATKISVKTEYAGQKDKRAIDLKKVDFDENHRISSRLTVKNKYMTDMASSEGFYLYMFKEYSEKLTPKPIYMKIEFNHAGIGKTIPFIIPMSWSKSGNNDGKMYPHHYLSLNDNNDLNELKEGFPLSYKEAQSYIPLYAVYDFKNNEYCYVFDNRYIGEIKDGILDLNLFEMKFKDESNEASDNERKNITLKKQERAIINVNKQFEAE